jgi:hypothetical protein
MNGIAQITSTADAKKMASKRPLSTMSVAAAREYLRLCAGSTESTLVRSAAFVMNIESTPQMEVEDDPTAHEHLEGGTDAPAPRPQSGSRASKQHRTESTAAAATSYDAKRSASIRTNRCRFCGRPGHSFAFRDGMNTTACPYFETGPGFNPADPWEYALQVERGEAEASQKPRLDQNGKAIVIPAAPARRKR